MVSLQAKRLKQILSPSQARPERLNYMHAYKTYRNVRQSNATLEQHLILFFEVSYPKRIALRLSIANVTS